MKNIFKFLAVIALAIAASSCYKQNDVYKEWIVPGGNTYPAKALNLTALQGEYRIVLNWETPYDPSITTAKVYWDNRANSQDVDLTKFPDGKVTAVIDNLEERTYTFEVVNFDAKGNKSLSSEVISNPLGSGWISTHTERSVKAAYIEDDSATVKMSPAAFEMVATKFRYVNNAGETVEYKTTMGPDETVIRLPDAKRCKYFEYKSAYYQAESADTIWVENWTKSFLPILFKIPYNADTWTIKYTKNQLNGKYTPDKMFDGLKTDSNSRYYTSTNSSYRKVLPKIFSVDTGLAEGEEPYTIAQFIFYQHPDNASSRYISNFNFYVSDDISDFNVDAGAAYEKTFPEPVASISNWTKDEASASYNLQFPTEGSCFAFVFTDSYAANKYIDIWELEVYAYYESEVED